MASQLRAVEQEALDEIWEAQPGPQSALIACPIFEVFFGGARGGGKTDGVLGDFLEHEDAHGRHAIGLMIRRTRTELIETIERSRQIYGPLGWSFNDTLKMWRSPRGGRLRFAYLERDADAEAYQGHSYTRLYVEEIGNFPNPAPVLKLMATLRSAAGVPVGFRATGNPGGPGQGWVKARYIDPAPSGWKVIQDEYTGLERVFIPSKVMDNKYLAADYVQRLRGAGSDQLVRAWLEGDWSAIESAFFGEWSTKHILQPFDVPPGWLRFRSMDWGSAAPFSVGWWAVVGDEYPVGSMRLPRGALVRYREWYGASSPNVGLKMVAEDVGRAIAEREGDEGVRYGVLDPAAFAEDGGPSIAERINRNLKRAHFRPADNKRVGQRGAMGGWDMMRARLRGDGERPMFYVFDTCIDFIRTVPMLQHDAERAEDLDTAAEDHVADEARYACMSRPWMSVTAAPTVKTRDAWDMTES